MEQEQQGEGKAEYGVQLLEHLPEDLQRKLGSGFSIRNLRNMRRFYLHHRIRQAPAELNWTQHVELLPVVAHTITINTHDTWSTSFTYLIVRTPRRFTGKAYTSINNSSIRDLPENGSRDIGSGLSSCPQWNPWPLQLIVVPAFAGMTILLFFFVVLPVRLRSGQAPW